MNKTCVYEIYRSLNSVFYLHFTQSPNFFGVWLAFYYLLLICVYKELATSGKTNKDTEQFLTTWHWIINKKFTQNLSPEFIVSCHLGFRKR